MTEKERFLRDVCIIIDTREKKNTHITDSLDGFGVKFINKKLPFGDYSFTAGDTDFSLLCSIERKANINELWQNVTCERTRFEAEISRTFQINRCPILLIENCESREFLRSYCVPQEQMRREARKVENIGKTICQTLDSWSAANRFNLRVHYARVKYDTAPLLLSIFYSYYHNFKRLCAPQKKGGEQP